MKLPLGIKRALAFTCAITLAFEGMGLSQQPLPSPQIGQASLLTPDQLDTFVAPIALYPDPLISQILVASTYPLELVQAKQFIQQHPNLKGQDLVQAAQQQNWDASVQALVAFPDVISRLNQDITWTTNLGNAFLARQSDVMDAVQRMRIKAEQSGKLKSTPQQKVESTNQNGQTVVSIEPTNPAVIYVPVYNPEWIWGPPVSYYYPAWYYPLAPAPEAFLWFATGVFLDTIFWGCCGWGGWGWRPYWYHHDIFINNHFIHRYNFERGHINALHGETTWHHEALHRMGVAYPNRELSEHFRSPAREHPQVGEVQRQLNESAGRVRSAPMDRIGGHQIQPGVFNRNRSAFGGMEGGTSARVHGDRGFSSMGRASMRPQAPMRAPAGGGHAGGGWGGGRHR